MNDIFSNCNTTTDRACSQVIYSSAYIPCITRMHNTFVFVTHTYTYIQKN